MTPSLSPDFRIGDVIDNATTGKFLPGPSRILGWSVKDDYICMIPLPCTRESKPNQMATYLGAPRTTSLSQLMAEKTELNVVVLNIPKAKSLPDEAVLAACNNSKHRLRMVKRFEVRDKRYALITPIIMASHTTPYLRAPLEIAMDPELGKKVAAIATREPKCSRSHVYRVLHLFLAGGSKRNALMPGYDRVGNPGKSKPQQNKLGRPTRLFAAGKIRSKGYILDDGRGSDSHLSSESDKRKLAYGWKLIKKGVPAKDAFLQMSSAFWAAHETAADGSIKATLFPPHLRPSFGQFTYWGKRLNQGRSIAESMLGTRKWQQRTSARGGSVRDQVAMVGQLATMDSTSTDVFLTSITSRLKVLPAMSRVVIKDLESDLIIGFHCGWEPISPAFAFLAILSAASSKVAPCASFGVQITDEEWPSMLHRMYQVDHGEMKAQTITEAESHFGFGVEYVQTFRGDLKGSIESQHHIDHKKLDEKLPGNTGGGRHTNRGEDHATKHALLNYYEYMHELINHILWFNNVDEAPALAPLAMMAENPDMKPTRLNIFNWHRARMSAEISVDTDELKAFTLPDQKAVIRKNGIYLVVNVLGREQLGPRLRYTSSDFVATGLMSRVKTTGHVLPTTVKMDVQDLRKAWLPINGAMVPLALTGKDSLLSKMPLADYVSFLETLKLAEDLRRGEHEQHEAETLARQQQTKSDAAAEKKSELKAVKKPMSGAAVRRSLRQNRTDELEALNPKNPKSPPAAASPAPKTVEPASQVPTAADDAMDAANRERI